jgi:hypothetical protein
MRAHFIAAILFVLSACSSSSSTPDAMPAGACFVELSGLAYSNDATCTTCQATNCDTALSAVWGSAWKTGDYCSGGSCGAFMKCMNDCHGAATCEDGCKSLATTACMTAITDANTCSDSKCKPQCNP